MTSWNFVSSVDSLPLSHLGISKCKIEKCYFLFSYENTEIHHFLKSGSEWLGLVLSIKPKTYWCQYLQFKNTGVGCHFFLQGIFLIQWWNSHVLHCRGFFLLSPWEARDLSILLSSKKQLFALLIICFIFYVINFCSYYLFQSLLFNSDTDLLLVSAFCLIW